MQGRSLHLQVIRKTLLGSLGWPHHGPNVKKSRIHGCLYNDASCDPQAPGFSERNLCSYTLSVRIIFLNISQPDQYALKYKRGFTN